MHILSVNVGGSQPVTIKDRSVQTGIFKIPATAPVSVSPLGLKDDVHIEERKMGLEHSAVYAYPFEHYDYWQKELGREEPFPMGQFGENLTVTGMLEEEVRIGDIFRFGSTVLQVAAPRIPCNKLNARMGLRFAGIFLASCKVGYYCRVLTEGTVEKNDSIELLERDENSPTMEEFVHIAHYEYWDVEALQYLLQARDMVPTWREMIEAKLVRAQTSSGWHGMRELELVAREQENEDTLSLYLKCAKGKPLAPFHGGQQLMVMVGGRTANQPRRPYYLSSNPHDISSYRITLHQPVLANQEPDANDLSDLATLQIGERILCNSPHGSVRSEPETSEKVRNPVLISQGLGIAPMLSLLYELETRPVQPQLFHESTGREPLKLLSEVNDLIAQHSDMQMLYTEATGMPEKISAELIREHVSLPQADIHIAGSRDFIERLENEFMAIDFSPAALITLNID